MIEYFEIKIEMNMQMFLKKLLKSMNKIENSLSHCYLFDSIWVPK